MEYVAPKTKRDETREQTAEEIEKHRLEMAVMAEKKAYEKSMQPKRAPMPRKEEWEVESILSMKEVNGNKFYKVKFVGYNKPTWEPEENVEVIRDSNRFFVSNGLPISGRKMSILFPGLYGSHRSLLGREEEERRVR